MQIVLSSGYPERAVAYTGEVVTLSTTTVYWNGIGQVYLDPTAADDALRLQGPSGTLQFHYLQSVCGPPIIVKGPFDITSIFQQGINQITIYVVDICGGAISCQAVSISGEGLEGVSGKIYHHVDLLKGTTNYPLNKVKVTLRAYYQLETGATEHSYTYTPIYTNSAGAYYMAISTNPFSMWDSQYLSFELRKLLTGAGWNRVQINLETCSVVGGYTTIWSKDSGQVPDLYLPHTLTEKLYVKRLSDNSPIENASVDMLQSYKSNPPKLTDADGLVQFTVYPMYTTHKIQKEAFRTYTPIFNLFTGHDCRVCQYGKTVQLEDLPAPGGEMLRFSGKSVIGYYPDQTMQMEYNVGMIGENYRNGAYIKLFKHDNSLAARFPPSGGLEPNYFSPPTKDYTPGTGGMRGTWLGTLYDGGNNVLANDLVYFGTAGKLEYDLSKICSDSKVIINYSDIDPVNRTGTYYNKMTIKIYDSLANTKTTEVINSSSGSVEYTLKKSDDKSGYWKAELIDQWNVVIYTVHFQIIGCNQLIYGKVERLSGYKMSGYLVHIDLSDMGFGKYIAKVEDGLYTISGIPPFPTRPISARKTGFKTDEKSISLANDEYKKVDFVLEGMIKGTITDEEGKGIENAYAILEGIEPNEAVEQSRPDGTYDIPATATGSQKLRFMKNNFDVEEEAVNVTAEQVIKNITMKRRALEMFSANFKRTNVSYETSLVQLDEIDREIAGIMGLENSSQKIALVEVMQVGAGESLGTGAGPNDGEGDIQCEYFGDDENGKPIYRCNYVDRDLTEGNIIAMSLSTHSWPLVGALKDYGIPDSASPPWKHGNHIKNGQMITVSHANQLTSVKMPPWVFYSKYEGLPDAVTTVKFYKASASDPNQAVFTLLSQYSMSTSYPEFVVGGSEAEIEIGFEAPINVNFDYLWVEISTNYGSEYDGQEWQITGVPLVNDLSIPIAVRIVNNKYGDPYSGGKLYENTPPQNGIGTWSPAEDHVDTGDINNKKKMDLRFVLYGSLK